MEAYLLILFLAGQKVEHPDSFTTKDECIEAGKVEVDTFKRYHPHSKGWFWCLKRYST